MATATASVGDIMKDIRNTQYNSDIITTATVGSRYLTTKIVGMKGGPSDFKQESIGMLASDADVGSMVVKSERTWTTK